MAILNIEPVSRRGMRFMISLYGLSETGKTKTGLLLAAGIEPNPKKRGMLDTEGGQRGRAYVDEIPGGYQYGHMSPPFTPERYIEAISEFEAAGITALVIDSVSHAWFAEGGVLDMVENSTDRNDMAKWKGPKRRLGKMTRRILSSDMHIILCSRGKEPMLESKDENGKKIYIKGPVVPIQEKSLRFDMTIMAQMIGDGRYTVTAPAGKCPGALRAVFEGQELMNEDTGRKLIAWLGQQSEKTPELRALEAKAAEIAEGGRAPLKKFWDELTEPQREFLRPGKDNLLSVARAADADREERAREEREGKAIDDPFDKPPETTGPALKIEDATTTTKSASAEPDAWADMLADLKRGADACKSAKGYAAWLEDHQVEIEQLAGSGRADLVAAWTTHADATDARLKPAAKAAAE